MILKFSRKNTEYTVTRISASGRDYSRLLQLGITVGARLKVNLKLFGGGVIVEVGGAEIAIGREIAHKIEVEQCKK